MNNTYLTVTVILCTLGGTWVKHNTSCMHDSEGKTDDERTVIREKGNKRLDQVGLRGGKRKR